MLAFDPERASDEICCFIGTTAAILLAASAAATAGGAAYAAHENTHAAQVGSDAAVKAAQIQADAAQKAADTASEANRAAAEAQLKAANDALTFQKQVYAQKQAQVAPYIGMGQGALSALGAGLGVHSVPQPPPAMPTGGTGADGVSGLQYGISPPKPPTPALGAASAAQATTTPTAQGPTLANLGMPQAPNQSVSSLPAAQVGEQRTINGVPAVWTGQGWRASQSGSSVGVGA